MYEYLPTICPVRDQAGVSYDEEMSRVMRWHPARGVGDVEQFRRALDDLTVDDVRWTPWVSHRGVRPLQDVSLFSGHIRCASYTVPYLPERVVRQFGYRQMIPRPPPPTRSAEAVIDAWINFHLHTIRYTVQLFPLAHPAHTADGYLDWYRMVSHPRLIPPAIPAAQNVGADEGLLDA